MNDVNAIIAPISWYNFWAYFYTLLLNLALKLLWHLLKFCSEVANLSPVAEFHWVNRD